MDRFAKGILGGLAGGLKAVGEVADDDIKSRKIAERDAVLEARALNMQRLQQEYQTSERKANQAFQTRNEAKDMAADASLAGYLRGDNQVAGGDAYAVPIGKDDYKKTMDSKGLLAIKAMEKSDTQGDIENKRNADRDKLDAERFEWDKEKFPASQASEIEKQMNYLAKAMPDVPKEEILKLVLKSKDGKTDLGREKLYSDTFEKTLKALSQDMAPTPEMIDAAHVKAVKVSGFNPDINTSTPSSATDTPQRGKDGKLYIKKPDGWYLVEDEKPTALKQATEKKPEPIQPSTEELKERTYETIKGNAQKSKEAEEKIKQGILSGWDKLRKVGNKRE